MVSVDSEETVGSVTGRAAGMVAGMVGVGGGALALHRRGCVEPLASDSLTPIAATGLESGDTVELLYPQIHAPHRYDGVHQPSDVHLSPCNRFLCVPSTDSILRIFHTSSGLLYKEVNHVNATGGAMSPTGLLAYAWGCNVVLYCLQTDTILKTMPQHTEAPLVCWTGCGKYIVSVAQDAALHIWNALKGERVCGYEADGIGNAVATAGEVVVVAVEAKVMVLGLGAEVLKELSGHEYTVLGVAITSDAGRIVSASSDETARVWDTSSGVCLQEVVHGQSVFDVAVSSANIFATYNAHNTLIWAFGKESSIFEIVVTPDVSGTYSGLELTQCGRFLFAATPTSVKAYRIPDEVLQKEVEK